MLGSNLNQVIGMQTEVFRRRIPKSLQAISGIGLVPTVDYDRLLPKNFPVPHSLIILPFNIMYFETPAMS
jgi:hypothetical protein